MKKTREKEYGEPLLIYPGLTMRAGSMLIMKKEPVNKFVDNATMPVSSPKNKHVRAVCLKSKQ